MFEILDELVEDIVRVFIPEKEYTQDDYALAV